MKIIKNKTININDLFHEMQENSKKVPLYLIHCSEHIQYSLTKLFKRSRLETIELDIIGEAAMKFYRCYITERIIRANAGDLGISDTHLLLNIKDVTNLNLFLNVNSQTIYHLMKANKNDGGNALIVFFIQDRNFLQEKLEQLYNNEFKFSMLGLTSTLFNKNKVKVNELINFEPTDN